MNGADIFLIFILIWIIGNIVAMIISVTKNRYK